MWTRSLKSEAEKTFKGVRINIPEHMAFLGFNRFLEDTGTLISGDLDGKDAIGIVVTNVAVEGEGG